MSTKDITGSALVEGFAAVDSPAATPERPDDWETPLPKRQREERGETYSVEITCDGVTVCEKAKHPGETMAYVEMLGKLDRAAWEKVEASGKVLDGDHVMYVGVVKAAEKFAVLHGEPKR
jgi:hypothetical protein